MLPGPAPQPFEPDEDEQAWLAWLEAEAEFQSEAWISNEDAVPDPDRGPPPDTDLNDVIAETDEIAAREAQRRGFLGFTLGGLIGRRGPGQPGSAESFPGVFDGPGGGFATGQVLDTECADPILACLAGRAAGEDDDYTGVSDDELIGILGAWERMAGHAAARRYMALAELTRRRPKKPGTPLDPTGQLPIEPDEFLAAEVADAMAWTKRTAHQQLNVAWHLRCRPPWTREALRDGILDEAKAKLYVDYTAGLTPEKAEFIETLLSQVAGSMTLTELRQALALAATGADPGAAARRRKEAGKDIRVEMRPEFSGNGFLAGRELPPGKAIAADQRITWWATQLRDAGLDGTLNELRARAYLDLLLGLDSRPAIQPPADNHPFDHDPPGPCDGPIPAGFTGQINLTVPLTTLLGMTGRPAELGTFGAIDPDLARDIGADAAQAADSRWCITVTDDHGHPIGHGCGRKPRRTHGSPGGGFGFTARGQPGPAGGYGTWQLTVPGRGDLTIALQPLGGECDHRFEANGHDPGMLLQHLTSILHPTCTAAGCRRPASQCDYEHNTPYEAGGRTCLCNGDPKCQL